MINIKYHQKLKFIDKYYLEFLSKIKFLTKAKNYYFDQLAKYLPKIEIYWYNYSHNFQIIKPTENQRKTNNIVRYHVRYYPLRAMDGRTL